MNKADLKFLQSTLIMERFLGGDPFYKLAQDNTGGAFGKVQSEVSQLLAKSKEHPVESILAFIGPGLLWILGFKKISAAFALAEALGFNWEHFFESIKEKLKPLLTDMHEGKHRDSSEVQTIVQQSGEEAFSGQGDPKALQDAVETYGSLNNMLFIQKLADRYKQDPAVTKMLQTMLGSVGGNTIRKGMLGFIVRLVGWLITAVVIAAGFKIIGKGVSHILGIKKDTPEDSETPSDSGSDTKSVATPKPAPPPEDLNIKLYRNPNASPELFTTTFNDKDHIWLLHMNIADIRKNLIKWAQDLYPQLTDESAFDASDAFAQTLRAFTDRNKDTGQIDILAVPAKYHSINEIVLSFAYDVATHMKKTSDSRNV